MESNIFRGKTPDQAKDLFRQKVKQYHPDHGGTAADFIQLRKMYDEYKKSLTEEQSNYLDALFNDDPEITNYLNSLIHKLPANVRQSAEFRKALGLLQEKITPDAQNLITSAFRFFRNL